MLSVEKWNPGERSGRRVALVASAAVWLAACAGGPVTCSSADACGNAPSSSEMATCQSVTSSPCGSQFSALHSCEADNSTCQSGTSTLTAGACSGEQSDFATCCSANAMACGGS